jgi:hypothetical protein
VGGAGFGQSDGLDQAANDLFATGYPTPGASQRLNNELLFQSAVQTYLWALPALNMYAMKEGSEKVFGKGYNVLPIWKQRLNAKTLITTPNSDVIYAMGYLDLRGDGPTVIEAPPGLQGILDDFWQRPICSDGAKVVEQRLLKQPPRDGPCVRRTTRREGVVVARSQSPVSACGRRRVSQELNPSCGLIPR